MDPQAKDIAILMLSARGKDFDKAMGLVLGADAYEAKPFSPPHLATKIKKMCEVE